MSSVAHAKVKTIDKSCLLQAAEELGQQVQKEGNTVNVSGVRFAFNNEVADVSFIGDSSSQRGVAQQLTQLSSFYTMKNRMEKLGFALKTATKDAVNAVRAGQSIAMEYEEVSVGA